MKKKQRYQHGGGRPLTGIYMTSEESARYEEACKRKEVSKSAQGAKLLTAWTNRILGK